MNISMKTFTVNANKGALNPAIVAFALEKAEPGTVKASAHSAQKLSWFTCAMRANAIEFKVEEFPDLPKAKLTLGGVSFETDDTLPVDCVRFFDSQDQMTAEIIWLAIPFGFDGS